MSSVGKISAGGCCLTSSRAWTRSVPDAPGAGAAGLERKGKPPPCRLPLPERGGAAPPLPGAELRPRPPSAPRPPGTMSGSGPDASQPGSAEESGLQEAERDWAAAKAFYDNLVTKRPRPVSGGGMGLGITEVPGEPSLPSSRPCSPSLSMPSRWPSRLEPSSIWWRSGGSTRSKGWRSTSSTSRRTRTSP